MKSEILNLIEENIKKVMIGNDSTIRLILTALTADGHVLLEDVPGTGKTVMAKSLARSMDADFGRVQFTPDLLPSDVTGLNYFDAKSQEFVFSKGPAFCNILLADEINRATPKTQSALLECMAERQITVDGVTRGLEKPFLVIATENPLETLGTFPLPEAQLDRFLMKLSMEELTAAQELQLAARFMKAEPLEQLAPVCTAKDVAELQAQCREIYIHPELMNYMIRLVQASRKHAKVASGISPRGTLAFIRATQGYALVCGRDYVIPEDIKAVAVPVLAHRLSMQVSFDAAKTAQLVIQELLNTLELPTEEWKAK